MPWIGVAHNLTLKFDYDTRTTTAQGNFLVTCLCLCWKNIIDTSHKETARGTTREMPNLRETRNCIAYAYRKGFINDREFVLLFDANWSKTPDFPYWNYERFELDELTNANATPNFASIKMTYTNLRMPFSYQTSSWRTTVWLCNLFLPCVFTKKYFHIPAGIVIWFFTLQDRSQRSAS